jgi:hypothetical protein
MPILTPLPGMTAPSAGRTSTVVVFPQTMPAMKELVIRSLMQSALAASKTPFNLFVMPWRRPAWRKPMEDVVPENTSF